MDKHQIGFAVAGSLMSIVFFGIVNYLTSPDYTWFIYPAFVLLLWPMSMMLMKKGKYKLHAIAGSVLVIAFLITINALHSPEYAWSVYAVYPVIWWPISVCCGNRARTLTFAFVGSLSTILYYSILNYVFSPQYPWVIYPTFAVVWWPLVLYYVQKRNYFGLSISASLLITIFFIMVNAVSTPGTIWAIYPIFISLWWPLSMYYFRFRRDQDPEAPSEG